MKKKLLALAVAGAFAAPFAAMADTANVTVYGVANVSFDVVNNGDGTDLYGGAMPGGTGVNKVSSGGSRIGFKGSEDLGGGLNAIWQIESAINIDNSTANASTFATRNTFAGLSGESWGSLVLGRNDSPYKTSTRKLDVFADTIADNRSLMGGAGMTASGAGSATAATITACNAASGTAAVNQANANTCLAGLAATAATATYDDRPADSITYTSPNMSGFTAAVQYVAAAETVTLGSTSKQTQWGLSGAYDVAPFYGSLAYTKRDHQALTGTTQSTENAWKLGLAYKMDQFEVNFVYERLTDDTGGKTNATAVATGCAAANSDCMGRHNYYLAGKFNVSSNDAVKLAYARAGELASAGGAGQTKAKQISIGYDHSMSKRTTVYALYTKLDNDNFQGYSLGAPGFSTGNVNANGAGADPHAISVGMKHTF